MKGVTTRDVAVIGGGPAGLTAGLYLCRARIDTVLLEVQLPGGQAIYSPLIENYPGFPDGIPGPDLIDRMKAQVDGFGLELKTFAGVTRIENGGPEKSLVMEGGDVVRARAVIIATGRMPKKMGIPGEEEFSGRGVSYCATCDGPFFREKVVMVIGGGDAAVEEALHLVRFASRVILVHRRDSLRASDYLQERALSEPGLELMWNTELLEVRGGQTVESALVVNNRTGERGEVPVSGVFFYVGNLPSTSFVSDLLELDDEGYIITDEKLETGMPGIFAAGDARSNLFKQVVVASGEGALAAMSAQRYLESVGARQAYEGGR